MKLNDEQLAAIIMCPKTFLRRGRKSKERIDAKMERLEEWKALATKTTATVTDMPGGGGTGRESTIETHALNIMEIQQQIQNEIDDLAQVQSEIMAAVDQLLSDSTHKLIIELYYLNNLTWEEVAVKTHYSYRWVMTLHGQALTELQEQSMLVHAET